jgi:hypothetical protein
MANPELNSDEVVAKNRLDLSQPPDPSAMTVIIKFDQSGNPVSVAHSDKKIVSTKDLDKLAFAQVTLAAEDPANLKELTPENELKNTQGTPQWGFRGGVYRGPNGGVIAGGRGYGGYGGYGYRGGYYGGGYGGYGYGAGYYGGGYGYGYGGWNPNYWGGWNNGGWGWNTVGYGGGCGGCCGCSFPVYAYAGCQYAAVGWWGGGGAMYGMYQPAFY